MKRVLAWAGAILIGLALGAGSAWWALDAVARNFAQEQDGWRWSRLAGSPAADPYIRAVVARDGLLALSADEALYFTLDRDERGRPLRETCVYELSGPQLPGRWWSVTLYARDNFLARNGDHAFSVDATRTAGEDHWTARIAPVRGDAAHWISSRSTRRGFLLMLRVYNPDDNFPGDGSALPDLHTLSCPEGQT